MPCQSDTIDGPLIECDTYQNVMPICPFCAYFKQTNKKTASENM